MTTTLTPTIETNSTLGPMPQTSTAASSAALVAVGTETRSFGQAYQMLHIVLFVLPLVDGIDKFFNLLTNWEKFTDPRILNLTGLTAVRFMEWTGVAEIIIAIGVLLRPRIFGNVLGVWLLGIVAQLLLIGSFFEIAVQDVGLTVASFALAQLAAAKTVMPRRSKGQI